MKYLRFVLTMFILSCVTYTAPLNNPPSISNPLGWYRGTVVTFQGDVDFTLEERAKVEEACQNWAAWTDKGITCKVDWGHDFIANPFLGEDGDYGIMRINHANALDLFGDTVGERMLGVCQTRYRASTGERTILIMLVDDMIRDFPNELEAYRMVAAHEFGHAFGFSHTCTGEAGNQCSRDVSINLMNPVYDPRITKGFGPMDSVECRRIGLCR